jgi:hypothetical protein
MELGIDSFAERTPDLRTERTASTAAGRAVTRARS